MQVNSRLLNVKAGSHGVGRQSLRPLGTAVIVVALAVAALVWTLSISRRSVAFAFAINWALMGLAFVVWLVAAIRFGRGYYQVHRFERSGRLYEWLGVRAF